MYIFSIDLRLEKTLSLGHYISEPHCISSLGCSLIQIFPQRRWLEIMVLWLLLLIVSIYSWGGFNLPNY